MLVAKRRTYLNAHSVRQLVHRAAYLSSIAFHVGLTALLSVGSGSAGSRCMLACEWPRDENDTAESVRLCRLGFDGHHLILAAQVNLADKNKVILHVFSARS